MKISVIIPTHNRADSLKCAIDSVLALGDAAEFEVVVVDNNSRDHTRDLILSYGGVVRYVFEGSTSFTCARSAGAANATGAAFLYLDDDVIVKPGALDGVARVFREKPACGVIAGHIEPRFVVPPPPWALDCQRSFNGWSLYNPRQIPALRRELQEVEWAAGPMMAIRTSTYNEVGGFPPDTIGVETNRGKGLFSKLYVGPGDYGLCVKAQTAGYKVYYSGAVSCEHVIPPVRCTVQFWRSRMIGEAYHATTTDREFYRLGPFARARKRIAIQARLLATLALLRAQLDRAAKDGTEPCPEEGILAEEMWLEYYKAFLQMDVVLDAYPWLSAFLWEIGKKGVTDANYEVVMARLPLEYALLVSDEHVYGTSAIRSVEQFDSVVSRGGEYERELPRPTRGLRKLPGLVPAYRLLKSARRRLRRGNGN